MIRTITILLLTLSGPVCAQDFNAALEHARKLAEEHKYRDVIEVLGPFGSLADSEDRYIVAAELGRAYFHLGDYSAADTAFRQAVTLRPKRAETALYLQATSYLTGNRAQAYIIFRELIASGATDLHLAVSLPGERIFLADPEVWSILDELSRPVDVDFEQGALLDVEMGMQQPEVERRLRASPGPAGEALTARAGPHLTWVFAFDENHALAQIMLHNEHLYRYTPYRLRFSDEFDWQATPAAATRALGAPVSTQQSGEEIVIMVWDRETVRLTLEFALPRLPTSPDLATDKAVLRVVRMVALGGESGDPDS